MVSSHSIKTCTSKVSDPSFVFLVESQEHNECMLSLYIFFISLFIFFSFITFGQLRSIIDLPINYLFVISRVQFNCALRALSKN
ncbi:hypothetical protein BpHYR1_017105 [Brachionus plicatilis]|uniref:Uncharacterized protein n=1 Tax=Brachionus plicatilis TaxID=10195 RepID=A0A3M7RUG5_BRAPC|nr:hypothetical protein BpHYR1_017105 [Brachionus plicatilis]